MQKSRNWVFTINNPTDDIDPSSWANVSFMIMALEIGDSGTLHYQGYLEWSTARGLSTCKQLLPTAHWEVRRGNRLQAIQYVLKTIDTESYMDNNVDTFRDILHQDGTNLMVDFSLLNKLVYKGERTTFRELLRESSRKRTVEDRLNDIKERIKAGESDLSIADGDFDLWVKYNSAFSKFRLLNAPPRDFKTRVIVITGPTGTGKSKWAADTFPGAYWKPRSDWWDGYIGQDTVVLDEFYGWIAHDLLLRLCDRYPLNVQVKGGTVNFISKTIVITSNKSPKQWYKNFYFEAFERRVEEWRVYMGERQTISENYIAF